MKWKMAELFVQLYLNTYSKYIIHNKGEAVLYVEISKTLYGTLTESRTFWTNLTKTWKVGELLLIYTKHV